jgi:hypothetical protein
MISYSSLPSFSSSKKKGNYEKQGRKRKGGRNVSIKKKKEKEK